MLDSMIDPDCNLKECYKQSYLDRYAEELYDEASKMISTFICTRDYLFFLEKFRNALGKKDDWAFYMADEIGLSRKHIATLTNDIDLLDDLVSQEAWDNVDY